MMMKNFRKGQAALEFLTTYGWAFLVILVMIGALGYFGILNPSSFLPQRCTTGPEFLCEDYQLNRGATVADSNVSIILESNVGVAISSITNIDVSVGDETGATCGGPTSSVGAGSDIRITCNFTSAQRDLLPPQGDKGVVEITGDYLPVGKQFTQPLVVELYATVQ